MAIEATKQTKNNIKSNRNMMKMNTYILQQGYAFKTCKYISHSKGRK